MRIKTIIKYIHNSFINIVKIVVFCNNLSLFSYKYYQLYVSLKLCTSHGKELFQNRTISKNYFLGLTLWRRYVLYNADKKPHVHSNVAHIYKQKDHKPFMIWFLMACLFTALAPLVSLSTALGVRSEGTKRSDTFRDRGSNQGGFFRQL